MACADVPVELGNMSPHLAEAMLVVEDMPILKCINVMAGITRSKVFFWMCFTLSASHSISDLGFFIHPLCSSLLRRSPQPGPC